MMKRILAVLLTLVMLASLFSCKKEAEEEESFYPIYQKKNGVGDFSTESFQYDQYGPSGALLSKKGTGYRVVRTDPVTGETGCICIDPLCTHSIDSDCPAVFRYPVHVTGAYEDILVYSGSFASRNECWQYNTKTGEKYLIYQTEGAAVTEEIGGQYLFYFAPEIRDGMSVYSLIRYDLETAEYRTLWSNSDITVFMALSNQRVYFGTMFLPMIMENKPSYWSVDYNGDDFREETGICFSVSLALDSLAFGGNIGAISGYNVKTGEKIQIAPEDGACALGYWQKSGKLVYATYDNLRAGMAINPDSFCQKHGISYEEYSYYPEYRKMMAQERDEIFFGSVKRIVCCDLDGSNAEVLFELPKEIFIENGVIQPGRSGCISGDIMYLDVRTEGGEAYRCGINLNTGELLKTESGSE